MDSQVLTPSNALQAQNQATTKEDQSPYRCYNNSLAS